MNAFFIRSRHSLIGSAALFAILSCARKPDPSLDPMHSAGVCDTTPMKPLGRTVQIPEMHRRTDFGVLTGAVLQDETGDAIEGAVVDIRVLDRAPDTAQIWRYTNSKGGFSFDSLKPATYRLRARRLGQSVGVDTIHPRAGRVDTLSLRMRAYRCYGY
jgi:protocatechuate 3,4-dioxygenase beta subunit